MKVTVRVHASAETMAQFRAWRRMLPGTRDDRIRWGKFHLETLGHAVARGIAPAAVLKGASGDLIRWEYLKGTEFILLRKVISRNEMEVIVMGVNLLDPPRTSE